MICVCFIILCGWELGGGSLWHSVTGCKCLIFQSITQQAGFAKCQGSALTWTCSKARYDLPDEDIPSIVL